jgi:hypothetical protein
MPPDDPAYPLSPAAYHYGLAHRGKRYTTAYLYSNRSLRIFRLLSLRTLDSYWFELLSFTPQEANNTVISLVSEWIVPITVSNAFSQISKNTNLLYAA